MPGPSPAVRLPGPGPKYPQIRSENGRNARALRNCAIHWVRFCSSRPPCQVLGDLRISSVQQDARQRGRTTAARYDRGQPLLAAEVVRLSCAPAVRIERIRRRGQSASVPCPCQNGRKTAVAHGHSRTPRTASDLGMGWLTRCVKHTSKQRVAGSNPAGRARSERWRSQPVSALASPCPAARHA